MIGVKQKVVLCGKFSVCVEANGNWKRDGLAKAGREGKGRVEERASEGGRLGIEEKV